MSLFGSRLFKIYVVPGAVFQSVVIGGGYGTGREIVEYFTQFGLAGGLMGMIVTLLSWGVVLGFTYELARIHRAYDYRHFFQRLLGPAWFLFEILYILMLVLVLAVVASAAGEILREELGLPYLAGLAAMLLLVAVLMFYGRDVIARALTAWTFVLYAVFALYFVMVWQQAGGEIAEAFRQSEVREGWLLSGFKYAMYNLAIAPAILFATRDIATRREAMFSGFFSAVVCLIPGLLFHVSFSSAYPQILSEEIPLHWMIDGLGARFLLLLYVIVLFGTFVETGVGFIQGVNERLDGFLQERGSDSMKRVHRILLAVGGMLVSAGLALFGIVRLIADGYGLISWGFFVVYVIPVVVFGVLRLIRPAA